MAEENSTHPAWLDSVPPHSGVYDLGGGTTINYISTITEVQKDSQGHWTPKTIVAKNPTTGLTLKTLNVAADGKVEGLTTEQQKEFSDNLDAMKQKLAKAAQGTHAPDANPDPAAKPKAGKPTEEEKKKVAEAGTAAEDEKARNDPAAKAKTDAAVAENLGGLRSVVNVGNPAKPLHVIASEYKGDGHGHLSINRFEVTTDADGLQDYKATLKADGSVDKIFVKDGAGYKEVPATDAKAKEFLAAVTPQKADLEKAQKELAQKAADIKPYQVDFLKNQTELQPAGKESILASAKSVNDVLVAGLKNGLPLPDVRVRTTGFSDILGDDKQRTPAQKAEFDAYQQKLAADRRTAGVDEHKKALIADLSERAEKDPALKAKLKEAGGAEKMVGDHVNYENAGEIPHSSRRASIGAVGVTPAGYHPALAPTVLQPAVTPETLDIGGEFKAEPVEKRITERLGGDGVQRLKVDFGVIAPDVAKGERNTLNQDLKAKGLTVSEPKQEPGADGTQHWTAIVSKSGTGAPPLRP